METDPGDHWLRVPARCCKENHSGLSGDFLEGYSVAEVVEVSDCLVAVVVVVALRANQSAPRSSVVDFVSEDVCQAATRMLWPTAMAAFFLSMRA